MSCSAHLSRSIGPATRAVSPAGLQFVTEYTVKQRDAIEGTISEVSSETLRVADLFLRVADFNDVPMLVGKVKQMCVRVRKNMQRALEQSSSESLQLDRSAMDDYEVATVTREADRLEADKSELYNDCTINFRRSWFRIFSRRSTITKRRLRTLP